MKNETSAQITPPWAEHGLLIAEVAQAHDGSLGAAHAFIDAAARAGADAIKFQTHIAEAESTPAEPWRVRFSKQDETRYEYWQRTGFTPAQWAGLKEHADEAGLIFLSSPFSPEAVELLAGLGMNIWKIPSGEVTTLPLLEMIAARREPVMLSTGMSTWEEIDAAAAIFRDAGCPLAVLQCTTEYPCQPERWGLNMLAELRKRYGCAVGFSDHSGGVAAGLAAAALGADIVEVHVTFSREMFGPDVPASVTPDELRQLAAGFRAIRSALVNPVKKELIAAEKEPVRRLFGKSVTLREALPAGAILEARHLTLKKPGTGFPPADLATLPGRRLRHALPADSLLTEDDVE